MREIKVTYELGAEQYNAYNFTKRYGATICGKRSGKTLVGALWVGKKINDSQTPIKGLIVAPTYKLLDQAALDTLWGVFPEWKQYYKQQARVIELPRGDKIYCRSAEEPNSIEGLTVHFIWGDEAGMMKREVWRIMRARVSTTKGQVFLTTSPYTMNWCYHELYKPWKVHTDLDVEIFNWRTADNPIFKNDPEQLAWLEGERKRLSEQEYQREYEGVFTHLQGLIWDIPESQVLEESPMLEQVLRYPDRVVGGIDWGFHNPAAVVVAGVKDASYYLQDEWKQANKTTPEIIEQVKRMTAMYNVAIWFPDPAEPDRIEEMKRAGLHIGETNKDVALGLSYVASLVRAKRFFVKGAFCPEFLDEASNYIFQPNPEDKETREEPVKMNDHLCDAVRYMCMGYRPFLPEPRNKPLVESKENAIVNMLNRRGAPEVKKVLVTRASD